MGFDHRQPGRGRKHADGPQGEQEENQGPAPYSRCRQNQKNQTPVVYCRIAPQAAGMSGADSCHPPPPGSDDSGPIEPDIQRQLLADEGMALHQPKEKMQNSHLVQQQEKGSRHRR